MAAKGGRRFGAGAAAVKRLFATPRATAGASFGLLVLRLVSGVAFALHGWGKIQDPFGWMGPDATIPGVFQMLAAVAEFGGGIGWALGFLTPLASFGLACTMVVAVYMHAVEFGDPFVATSAGQGSYEPAAVYLAVSLLLLFAGPGRVALDRAVFGERS